MTKILPKLIIIFKVKLFQNFEQTAVCKFAITLSITIAKTMIRKIAIKTSKAMIRTVKVTIRTENKNYYQASKITIGPRKIMIRNTKVIVWTTEA